MTDASPFDPEDPVDALSEVLRNEVTDAFLRTLKSEAYHAASHSQQFEAFLAGGMVGTLGSIVAITQLNADNTHHLRAALIKHLPYWFDMALELNNHPTLGDIQ